MKTNLHLSLFVVVLIVVVAVVVTRLLVWFAASVHFTSLLHFIDFVFFFALCVRVCVCAVVFCINNSLRFPRLFHNAGS